MVTVVGIGDDGCLGLSARAAGAVAQATVLAGGARHLDFFPQFSGRKLVLDKHITRQLDELAELAQEETVCLLASGDPLFFGVGGLVARRMGSLGVSFIPHPSSVQWAFAKVGLPWEEARFLSFHGRPLRGLAARLRHARRAAVLTDPTNTPQAMAAHLLAYHQPGWRAWVGENLAGPGERLREFTLEALAQETDMGDLNLLILERTADHPLPPVVPWLAEEAFARKTPLKGLITKREVRRLALGALALRPHSNLWDIGAGSGSVAVEAAWTAPEGQVWAVEMDPEGAELCRANALAFGADNLTVVEGRAPEALAGLGTPDAVFVGGTRGSMEEILKVCWERLAPGGRLAVTVVTLDNLAEAVGIFPKLGVVPEVMLLQVSRGIPLAGKDTTYTRYEALNPIHLFWAEKPADG